MMLNRFVKFITLCSALLFLLTATDISANDGLDPTRPLVGSKTASNVVNTNKKLVLESIFHGSHNSKTHVVVINGKTMQVSDTIGEYRLVAVNDDSVVLRSSEKRLKLYIFSSKIIK